MLETSRRQPMSEDESAGDPPTTWHDDSQIVLGGPSVARRPEGCSVLRSPPTTDGRDRCLHDAVLATGPPLPASNDAMSPRRQTLHCTPLTAAGSRRCWLHTACHPETEQKGLKARRPCPPLSRTCTTINGGTRKYLKGPRD